MKIRTYAASIAAFLALCSLTALAQTGEILVASRQVMMTDNSYIDKVPVEAQRGERWEIVKKGKDKITVTFGPGDLRREISRRARRVVKLEVSSIEYRTGLVPEAKWPAKRRAIAEILQERLADLTLEECEKVIDGELWVGMKRAHAMEAIGNLIHEKNVGDIDDGEIEIWKVGFASLLTSALISAQNGGARRYLSTQTNPVELSDARLERELDHNLKYILKFRNGELIKIIRQN